MASMLLLLSACGSQSKAPVTPSEQVNVQGVALEGNQYRVVFLDGHYQVSKSRGYSTVLNTAENIAFFEKGLLDISKKTFSPEKYYFLEGQFLETEELQKWLSVRKQDNPVGLNETGENEKDFVVTILEQNFMTPRDGDYELSGMSLGVALNPKIADNRMLSDADVLERGKVVAAQLVSQVREKPGFAGVPIVVGLFKQSVEDGVSYGKYLGSGVSREQNKFEKWEHITVEKRVFPLDIDVSEESSVFSEFKRDVEKLFPNLNGVVGQAIITDGTLTELDVTITTQFYGQTEMMAFAQFLKQKAASTYPNSALKVTIKVESIRGTEIVVFKKSGENTYQAVVVNG